MAPHITLDNLEFASVTAIQRTQWTFAEVYDDDGCATTVEITCRDELPQVVAYLSDLWPSLKGREIAGESQVTGLLGLSTPQLQADLAMATTVSALRSAVMQLLCQHRGLGMTEALGGTPEESVALYANINRSIAGDWTTRNFATAAERAVREGFTVVKCAPFDDMGPSESQPDHLEQARVRIQRVAAVRAAVGPEVRVLVDCHSRLSVSTAPLVAEELARLDVGWFEEPLQPTIDADGLAEVAGTIELPVAGGEGGFGVAFFAQLLTMGAVNIVMPDIKYCGGVVEALDAGRAALAAGGNVSLHSPSGPISQLASAHVTSALPGALELEHAVNEAPWRADLITPPERIADGRIWMPGGSGLGATLNPDTMERYGRRWGL